MIRYTVYFNGEQVKVYELDEPVIFIGRLPENHIPISNMGISRRHVKIELDPQGGYMLSDLNSLNGSLVNGRRVKKANLCHGDKITIGKYSITYEDLRGGAASPLLDTIMAEIKPEELQKMAAAAGLKVPVPVTPAAPPPATPTTAPAGAAAASGATQNDAAQCAVFIETSNHIVYKLDRTYMTIGSNEEDDIYSAGFMIGKAYAVVEQRDGGYWLGTQKMMAKLKVNGKNIKMHRLEHKDRIEIGSNTFRFMENG
ncbi:MAG: FHA domain-containing protein [Chitinispirillales bacterium]|jgi:pSer/pThr/pTyr-binding forkhead associated (FHA) protein|nr:FHA domain-containing protein [Chitinispirillales bacterium]